MSWARPGWTLSVLAFLVVSVAVVPPASAQQGPFFTIAGEAKDATITCDLCSVTVYYNVTVRATNPTNPLNSAFDIYVTAGVNATPATQEGWKIHELMPRGPQRAKAGDVVQFSVVVEVFSSRPEGSQWELTFDAHARPQFTGESNPVTEQVIRQGSQETNAPAEKATVKRDLSLAQKLTGFARAQWWVLVVGAGALVVAGVVLVRRKKGGLVITTDAAVQDILAGRGASFPLNLRNEGTTKQAVTVGTSAVPAGWSAILPVDRVDLGSQESTTLWLTLRAPNEAQPGQHVQVSFVATTADGVTSELLLEATVVEQYGSQVPAPAPAATVPPAPGEAPAPTAPRAPRKTARSR